MPCLCVDKSGADTYELKPVHGSESGGDDEEPPAEVEESGTSHFKSEFLSLIAMGQAGSTANQFEEKIVCTLEGHEDAILNVEVGPDGKTLATCSADGTVKLWNIATAELLRTLEGHLKPVTNCAFSGPILATTSDDGVVFLWKHDSGRRVARLAVHAKEVLDCVFAKDGRALATCSADCTIRHFRIKLGAGEFVPGPETRTLKGHKGPVNVVAFTSDKKHIYSGSDDRTIKIWSRETRKCEKTLECDQVGGGVKSLRFSSTDDNCLVVLAREPGSECKGGAQGHGASYLSVWSLDGPEGNKEWSVRNVLSSEDTRNLTTISFIPDGTFLIGCTSDNRVSIWNCFDLKGHGSYHMKKACKEPKPTPHRKGILSCCFDPYGRHFITGDATGVTHVWM